MGALHRKFYSLGIPIVQHDWDRQNYEAMIPGFGGGDSMNWRDFIDTLLQRGFLGNYSIENEADLSKGTENKEAILQGFQVGIYNVMPMIWPLTEKGYQYDHSRDKPLSSPLYKKIPLRTMADLLQRKGS